MGEDSIARLFTAIDGLKDDARDQMVKQEKGMAEMRSDIRALKESVMRYQEITMSQETRIEAHNVELIKINERIKTALWVMAGVYTVSQVLGMWDRVRAILWG